MTRRSSLRARARRLYRERAPANASAAPTPKQTRLTARVRKLYEDSAVPVREIAALAGVTERTVYKYAAKHGWKPRYAWAGDRGWRARQKFAPVQGAGGRFISRADRGKPYGQGLKATDVQGERRAAAACAQAQALAAEAQREAEEQRRHEEHIRAIECVNRAFGELLDYREKRAKELPGRAAPANDPLERAYLLAVNLAADQLEALQAQQVEEAAAKQA